MAIVVHGYPATRNVAMVWLQTQEQASVVHMGKEKATYAAMHCS